MKKIVQEDKAEIEDEQKEQGLTRKRKWNTTTNTNIKTDVTLTDTFETEFMEGINGTANTSNTGVNTDANMDDNMNVTPISTAKEHMTEIDKEDDEEGIDHDVIFTSDEEDNIFDDMVKEDTLGYIKSDDNELQIVGETKHTFHFQPLTRSSKEKVGPLVQITKFQDIPFTGIGQNLRGLPRRKELVKGDGSCYFRAISFTIFGKQDYYKDVRVICENIENFPGKLKAILKNVHDVKSGSKYIEK